MQSCHISPPFLLARWQHGSCKKPHLEILLPSELHFRGETGVQRRRAPLQWKANLSLERNCYREQLPQYSLLGLHTIGRKISEKGAAYSKTTFLPLYFPDHIFKSVWNRRKKKKICHYFTITHLSVTANWRSEVTFLNISFSYS